MFFPKFKKIFLILALFFAFSFSAQAGIIEESTAQNMTKYTESFSGSSGLESYSIAYVISLVVKAFLGILGIIFLVLIISAGYNWMTAQGNEEKITKAKDTLKTAIIGLIIIVSAYAITYFVFNALPGGGGGGANITAS